MNDIEDIRREPHFSGELEYMTTFKEASRRSLNRVFHNLENFSYIMVSSDRGDLTHEQNLKRFAKLKKIVKDAGYSYIPVKGGYLENLPDDSDDDYVEVMENGAAVKKRQAYENSLIVFPFNGGKDAKSDEELFDFGLDLIQYDPVQQDKDGNFIGDPADVESFGQDSFLYKDASTPATYYGKDGNEMFSVGNNYILNDAFADYFTQLARSSGKKDMDKFTFTEAFIPSWHLSINEHHHRRLLGELL